MGIARTSYEFHKGVESLPSFIRRERRPITVFGGMFALITLAAIFSIDPAFFYPRLETDPLNYWLKAKSFVENGNTAARWAVNIAPFHYAAMPGILRAPLLFLFDDFDSQLRAIQIANIPIVGLTALLSAYILSWILPPNRHWIAIGFAFGFTLLNPWWMSNVFLPMVDAPYAVFTMAAIIVSRRILCTEMPRVKRSVLILLFLGLFAISFLLRSTAPAILLFVFALAFGRTAHGKLPWKHIAVTALIASVLVVGLVYLNSDAIFGRYLRELSAFVRRGDKIGMIINVVAAAVPAQLVPTFMQGFPYPPIRQYFHSAFFSSPAEALWTIAGLSIGSIAIVGMVKARDRFLPETLYFLGALPALALMMPSTVRYLNTYQAFIWVFFYVGAAFTFRKYSPLIPAALRRRSFALALVAAAAVIVFGLRAWRFVGTAADTTLAVQLTHAPRYVTDVSETFSGLRAYLASLPAEKTLLLSNRGSMGRWKVIEDLNYYYPDSSISRVAATKDMYLLIECGTIDRCQAWDAWKSGLEKNIDRFGEFQYELVYSISRPKARAQVYRIRNVD